MTKGEQIISDKLDTILEGLYDPDKGLFSRVKKNTVWRKFTQRVGWITLGGLIITALGKYL